MRRARSLEAFVADPVGCFNVGATHIVWCHSPTLAGTAHWGRPTERDAAQLVRRLEISIHSALADGLDVFMDARGMESFDWSAFGVVSEYVKSRLPQWSRRIRRHAIVVPSGVVGVFVAGLLPLVGTNHALRFFSSVSEALDWMGRAELAAIVGEVNHQVDEARGLSPAVRSLREYLDRDLALATLDRAAHELGLSTRTLQRELRRSGTQFMSEVMQARVRAAALLLAHSDEKIEVIARRVGCASSSQLSAIFKRHVGETPAGYRARQRGG